MRLIDADALKKELAKNITIWTFNVSYDGILAEIIDNTPTVELTEEQAIDKLHETGWLPRHDKEMTERPQGEWILYDTHDVCGEYEYFCDQCGTHFWFTKTCVEKIYRFCPNCGAKMEGAEP